MRNRFSFFSSWLETVDGLPQDQRLPFLEGIIRYGLEGVEPVFKTHTLKLLWINIRPVIDSSNAITDNTSKGGRPRKDMAVNKSVDNSVENSVKNSVKNSVSNSVINSVENYPLKEKEMEKEKEKEMEKETEIDIPPTSPQGEVPGGTSAKSFHFVAPSVEQVRDFMAAFCAKQGYALEDNLADRFCDFYGSKGWKVGRSPMKSWECTARNWCRDRGKSDTNVVNGITLGYDEHIDAQGQRYYISAKGIRIDIPADKRPRRKGEIWNAETKDWGFYD